MKKESREKNYDAGKIKKRQTINKNVFEKMKLKII